MPRSTAYSANSNLIITVIGCLLTTWLATPASAWQQGAVRHEGNQSLVAQLAPEGIGVFVGGRMSFDLARVVRRRDQRGAHELRDPRRQQARRLAAERAAPLRRQPDSEPRLQIAVFAH